MKLISVSQLCEASCQAVQCLRIEVHGLVGLSLSKMLAWCDLADRQPDFALDGSSLAEWVLEFQNLVVMQTLSKAWGLAGIRVGAAFTSAPIAKLLNSLKAPYNISSPSSALACAALRPENFAIMKESRRKIMQQRDRILQELPKIPGIGASRGGIDANFVLVEILDKPRDSGGRPSNEVALALHNLLAKGKGIVVRFRGKEFGCRGKILVL